MSSEGIDYRWLIETADEEVNVVENKRESRIARVDLSKVPTSFHCFYCVISRLIHGFPPVGM